MATESDLAAFVTQVTCPEDFDAFWGGALAELADIPLDAGVVYDPLRSTDAANVYRASYRSRDGLESFAWYAVPAVGDGPFPAVLILPGYKSEPAPAAGLGRARAWRRCPSPCGVSCPAARSSTRAIPACSPMAWRIGIPTHTRGLSPTACAASISCCPGRRLTRSGFTVAAAARAGV